MSELQHHSGILLFALRKKDAGVVLREVWRIPIKNGAIFVKISSVPLCMKVMTNYENQ